MRQMQQHRIRGERIETYEEACLEGTGLVDHHQAPRTAAAHHRGKETAGSCGGDRVGSEEALGSRGPGPRRRRMR